MGKRLVVTIAVGDKLWGEKALNLALSIKANDESIDIALICDLRAIKGIESLIDQHFDIRILEWEPTDSRAFSFEQKTLLYKCLFDICRLKTTQYDEVLFLDADQIILPARKVSDWFDELKDMEFACFTNDILEYGKSIPLGHTFWCDADKAKSYWKLDKPISKVTPFIPQTDACFIYFKKGYTAEFIFEIAHDVYLNKEFPYQEYKGTKLAELCFNIACSKMGILPAPHGWSTYHPVFLEAFGKQKSIEHIQHQYKSFGFAGMNESSVGLVRYYHKLANYYRDYFGIKLQYDALPVINPDKTVFVPTKKQNFVASIYLVGSKVNWNNFSQIPNIKLLEKWAASLKKTGLTGILFHNCFSKEEIDSFRRYPVHFSYVEMPEGHNSGLYRFELYADFIKKYAGKIDGIFFTDSTDLEVLRNPFTDKKFKRDKIYIGVEPWDFNHWSRQLNGNNLTKKYPDFHKLLDELAKENVLNAGLVGGDVKTITPFIKQMAVMCHECFGEASFQDMPIINLLAYTKFKDKMSFGHHVNTEMLKWDTQNKFSWMSHK